MRYEIQTAINDKADDIIKQVEKMQYTESLIDVEDAIGCIERRISMLKQYIELVRVEGVGDYD